MILPTRDSVLGALRNVQDPDLKQDLVTLNMIQDLAIQPSGEVSLKVMLTTPSCPLKEKIEQDVRQAVLSVPGVKNVTIKMDAQVRNRAAGAMASKAGSHTGAQQIEGVQNVIAVSSGKGGVGKSTVAVNLAVSLALDGARVGLMDTDVYGPNIPTMMGVVGQPKLQQHPTRGEIFVPPTAHGVQVMSMGFLIDPDQPLAWRGPMLHNIISQFCHKVNWGELDYLIVDMPPGTGDVQLSLSQLVPIAGAVLVTTPQEVSAQDVRKAYAMFEKVRVPVLGIVENMSYFVCDAGKRYDLFGKGGGQAIADKYGVPLLAQLPLVVKVREGGDTGRPVVAQDPKSPVAQAFRNLAGRVAQGISVLNASSGDGVSSSSLGIGAFH